MFLLHCSSVHQLINHFVQSCLLVAGACDNVLVVGRDVAAENGARLLRDKDGGSVGCAPGIKEVVLAG